MGSHEAVGPGDGMRPDSDSVNIRREVFIVKMEITPEVVQVN